MFDGEKPWAWDLWSSGFLCAGRQGGRVAMPWEDFPKATGLPKHPEACWHRGEQGAGVGGVTLRPNTLSPRPGAHLVAWISYPKQAESAWPCLSLGSRRCIFIFSRKQQIKNCPRYTVWPFHISHQARFPLPGQALPSPQGLLQGLKTSLIILRWPHLTIRANVFCSRVICSFDIQFGYLLDLVFRIILYGI